MSFLNSMVLVITLIIQTEYKTDVDNFPLAGVKSV